MSASRLRGAICVHGVLRGWLAELGQVEYGAAPLPPPRERVS
jgi:hypothetical protein